MEMQMSNRPYTVEVEKEACGHCGVGRMWTVVGPDGIALGQSWGEEEGAEELADAMNCAYAAGQSASARVVARPAGRTFWVVERWEDGHSVGYWDGGSSRNFVTDIHAAVQFCRHDDAFWVVKGWHWTDTKIVEHQMLPPDIPSEVPMQRGPMHSFCGDPECVICGGYSPVHDTDSPVARQEADRG